MEDTYEDIKRIPLVAVVAETFGFGLAVWAVAFLVGYAAVLVTGNSDLFWGPIMAMIGLDAMAAAGVLFGGSRCLDEDGFGRFMRMLVGMIVVPIAGLSVRAAWPAVEHVLLHPAGAVEAGALLGGAVFVAVKLSRAIAGRPRQAA